ncbi:UvrABC system protein A [Pirellulimonas nuda]|uniref:UvrABC system protein A n=1 Tax=Pirellulimonas nuda TaxID=2528009 RepID=A0A518DGG8_9BACT|nr:excinuclease ABC subunit UvrA [Pirellulimonas nuda]QDU90566.1 UvrABC system protein A [Pirellulimonas nuda]
MSDPPLAPNDSAAAIRVRGARAHNLKEVDLDLPRNRLIVFCGPSGSGKTSLAVDTLHAESQRRYLETFSTYARQFLDRLDRPDVDRIEGLPPAIAVTRRGASRSNRATVATATEIAEHLRLLLARVGRIICPACERPVERDSVDAIVAQVAALAEGARVMICFPAVGEGGLATRLEHYRALGFVRGIVGGAMIELASPPGAAAGDALVVGDRVTAGRVEADRLSEAIEAALDGGDGACVVLASEAPWDGVLEVDGRAWRQRRFSNRLCCEGCGREYAEPQPQLFNFNNPLGACPACEGFGSIVEEDLDLIVPDKTKSLREGAVAPWNTPAYAHELEELLALAPKVGLPVDAPFAELRPEHLAIIQNGSAEHEFGGLAGFFRWLERRKYKMHLRVFLSRWRSYRTCPECHGARLRPEALAVRLGGKNFADLCRQSIDAADAWFAAQGERDPRLAAAGLVVEEVAARLRYLRSVGLGYLTLDRTLRTLSSGEGARVAMTTTLGSNLVDLLYVLDEPSAGLHSADVDKLAEALTGLRDRGNTVLVIEHEESIIDRADEAVEFGPQAGAEGGTVVYQGPPAGMADCPASKTGDWLTGRRTMAPHGPRREPSPGWLKLRGARGHNLKGIDVEVPLGVLCVVSGVSGAGKSSLVLGTLAPAAQRQLHRDDASATPLPHDDLLGVGQLAELVLVDQRPVARSTRSNPVTYVKAMDAIRTVFAEQADAKSRGYGPGHFSFNVGGGRCETCQGIGRLEVDMQFMADVSMVCPDCGGTRFKAEVLDVKQRGLSIAEVLDLTVHEAFRFFRGHVKVQQRLKPLLDVGLDYLTLGQPASTLSGGEAQRLKLAGILSAKQAGRTLFVMDEPTTGLHMSDVTRLLDCFEALLAVGHSLLIVEHNLQLMLAADWVIDLGPGAGDAGGRVAAVGTPEQVAQRTDLPTGKALAETLARRRELEALPDDDDE